MKISTFIILLAVFFFIFNINKGWAADDTIKVINCGFQLKDPQKKTLDSSRLLYQVERPAPPAQGTLGTFLFNAEIGHLDDDRDERLFTKITVEAKINNKTVARSQTHFVAVHKKTPRKFDPTMRDPFHHNEDENFTGVNFIFNPITKNEFAWGCELLEMPEELFEKFLNRNKPDHQA